MELKAQAGLKNNFCIYEREYAGDLSNLFEGIHTHDCHEIFLLLGGDMDYFVEGTIFPMISEDFVIIGADTPHGKKTIKCPQFLCFVMSLHHDFFVENNCEEYEKVFLLRHSTEHKISADVSRSSGFLGAYHRLKDYTQNFTDTASSVTTAIIIEMLYILNTKIKFSQSYITNSYVQRIFDYVNENYSGKITLENIAEELFISKYHICKLFKKYAGYTVYQYITHKRLERTKQLINSGQNITSACIEAGFSDYSSFYKAYVKEYKSTPKTMNKYSENKNFS